MKKFVTMLSMVVLSSGVLCAADLLPPHGICALGRITNVREIERNQWSIEFSDVHILAQELSADTVAGSEAFASNKTRSMTVSIQTGLGGVLVAPKADWIGRTALFSAIKNAGVYTVPNLLLPLSPNGSSFVVFESDDTETVSFIKEAADILKFTNAVIRSERLVEVVESPTRPLFVRCFAVKQLAQLGIDPSREGMARRKHLFRWRNNDELNPQLRLCVDEVLVDHLPREYQIQTDRLEFLKELEAESELTPIDKKRVSNRLRESQRVKDIVDEAQK